MRHSRWSASAPTVAALLLGSWGLHALAPEPLAAQYFGRNKVQYEDFDFRVLELPHWDLYFYPGQEESISDIARMAERWYERFARTFQHEFERTKPLIMYADHPDFQQTNTLSGFIGEGTGGVTESLKNRIIMPQTGSYQDTDHVLGHEIVHAFQYNIAQSRRGGGIQGLGSLPLWLVEGMAEYLSVGRESPLTGMWLRDALREDDFPTIRDLSEGRRYFPYRFGQALWAYVGGAYGDDAVTQLFRRALRIGFPAAIEQVLGVQHDTLSADWKRSVERAYGPLMADRTPPDSTGTLLLAPSTGAGTQNLGPALSPDGRYITYLSEQDLFSIDLFLADANTGRVIRKLSSATSSPHFDALRYVESAGTWSPDGTQFAFAVFKGGDNAITIVNVESGNEVRTFHPLPSGAINNPSWSPDGRTIAFSGTVGGISDLYLWDLESDGVRRLTHDKHGDFHPDWSPDGSTIVFASDRGPETDFDRLVYSKFRLSFVDVESGHVSTPEIFGDTRHSDPHYGPEGRVYFLSAPDGFSDVFRYDPGSETTERITRIATGVSGHTPMAPALSVAEESGDLAFSVFSGFEFHVVRMAASPPTTTVATAPTPEQARGRRLPPQEPDRFSRVSTYLGDPDTGLEPPGAFALSEAESYQSVLALDYVGQPSFGVGTDRFGNYVGGGASAYFSDMLGNRVFGAAAQAQGTVRDIGGAVFYADLGHRWNRAIAVSHIPYVLSYVGHGFDERGPYLGQIIDRLYVSSAVGQLSYPFSQTRRFEIQGGFTRYASHQQIQKFYLDQFNRIYDRIDQNLDSRFEPLSLFNASIALVRDNSFMAFTSPVRGARSRYELGATAGTLNFITATADWRRYFGLHRNLTLAMRGLHFGRYGKLSEENVQVMQPTFLGYEWYVRGYAYNTFEPEECILSQTADGDGGSCPVRNRLFGHKLGVVSVELRMPLLGVEEYGLINFPFAPTELVLFTEGGIAWDSNLTNVDGSIQDVPDEPVWELSRSASERVPVFTTGISARFNVLGFMVLEAYYAYPWQRPDKGGHFGFHIAPGW
ncbi:MAG: peptidase S9 [Gemmatimonadota bacterium]|nr:peptidase S9 [Gemmatimonadota bacterium]